LHLLNAACLELPKDGIRLFCGGA